MDFVSAWKAASIVLTGAFGILGLVKDFKDTKTGRVSKWGYVSLVGILLSTGFGVAAQLKESSDDAAKSLKLLKGIDRELSSITTASIEIAFKVPCSQDRFVAFCRELHQELAAGKNWDVIPSSRWKRPLFPKYYMVRVGFLPKNVAPVDYKQFNFPQNTILEVSAVAPPMKDASLSAWVYRDGQIEIFLDNPSMRVDSNDGTLTSLVDLHGTKIFVGLGPLFDDLSITRFIIKIKDGEQAGFDVDRPMEIGRLQTNDQGFIYFFDCP